MGGTVYCDDDGKILKVFASNEQHHPVEGEAFSVWVEDDADIKKMKDKPDLWRFAGDNPPDGVRMRFLGTLKATARKTAEAKYTKTSNSFAAKVAEKRRMWRQQQDLAAMMPGARPTNLQP